MNDQTQFYSSRHPVEPKRLDAFVDAAFAFAVLSGLYVRLFEQARGSIDPSDTARIRDTGQWSRTWALAAVTGLVSGVIAYTPLLAVAPWLPGVTYQLIPLGIGLFALLDWRRSRGAPVART